MLSLGVWADRQTADSTDSCADWLTGLCRS
eukprot:COSAG04_NODE_22797_length_349_cov_0.548000_1_plen_29_part_01